MDTSKLASLVAASDHGSLSRAARQLGVRLSTASRHISDLEEELGEVLLIRTGRGVRPTPAGEQFIERARFILRELASAVAEVRGDREHAVTHLRISAPTELSLSLLPPCIAALHHNRPGIQLDLHSDARRVSLLEEEFDAAIRLGRLTSAELIARHLGQVQLLLCAGRCAAPMELTKRAFVGVAGTREQLSGKIQDKAFTLRVQPRIRVSTFTEAAEIAAATDLAVILPSYTAERFLRAGTLAVISPALSLPPIDVHLLITRRHRETTALKELAGLVSEKLRRLSSLPDSMQNPREIATTKTKPQKPQRRKRST